jgi:hypothetical protein
MNETKVRHAWKIPDVIILVAVLELLIGPRSSGMMEKKRCPDLQREYTRTGFPAEFLSCSNPSAVSS